MFKPAVMGLVFGLVASSSFAQGRAVQGCLHGGVESADNRARRQQAIEYAAKINIAETAYTIGPRQTPRGYRPLEELANLPPLPAGFDIQFHNDEQSYTFSLKDMRDPCHFAIFSDQEKLIYEATPRPGNAVLVPLGSR